MKNLTTVLFLVLAMVAPALAAPPVFNGSLVVPSAGRISMPPVFATPAPNVNAGDTVLMGDSITYGQGATSCVRTGSAPSGTCYADKLTNYFGQYEFNDGISGSTMQHNTCGSYPTSLIDRYQADLTQTASTVSTNTYVILIGTNDVRDTCESSSTFNPGAFESDLQTVVAAILAQSGAKNSQVILASLTYVTPPGQTNGLPSSSMQALQFQYQQAIAQVAAFNQVRFADVYSYMALNGASTNLVDGTHPNDTGHSLLAKAIEGATVAQAWSSLNALDYMAALGGNTGEIFTDTYNNEVPYGVWTFKSTLYAPAGINATSTASNFSTIGATTVYVDGGSSGATTGYHDGNGSTYGLLESLAANTATPAMQVFDVHNTCSGSTSAYKWYTGAVTTTLATLDCAGNLTILGGEWLNGPFNNATWTASMPLCTDPSKFAFSNCTSVPPAFGHNTCSASSGNPCSATVTCSISAGTTCSVNATVPASSTCTATANASDTTTGVESIKFGALSTNTLPVNFTVSSSQTTTAAANLTCL